MTNTAMALIIPITPETICVTFIAVVNEDEYTLKLPQIGLQKLSESQKKSSRHLEVQF